MRMGMRMEGYANLCEYSHRFALLLIRMGLFLFACGPLWGADWFPEGKQVFSPLAADLTQPAYAVRLTGPVGKSRLAEVNIGDEFGIFSWKTKKGGKMQVGLLGGVAARFDISKITNDLEVADYSGALPLDYSRGDWSARCMYWHTSSHLGDDYINHSNPDIVKNVTDEWRGYVSYSPRALRRDGRYSARIYTGGGYAFNLLPKREGRKRVQAGIELSVGSGSAEFFGAADLQSLERLGWQPSSSARIGWRKPGVSGTFSAFMEFFSGHLEYLGFMDRKETHWSLGMSFEM